ncbi:MAG: hypothetical protein KatS3mg111_2204 [Pirellulaceae bacterium]|nr:MAG: hypothetical protein KatS3mg111_2204 [Pirellulaceae bacterium]
MVSGRSSKLACGCLVALMSLWASPRAAQAGPLLDWLLGRRNPQPAYPAGPPIPLGSQTAGYAPYGTYYAPTWPSTTSVTPSTYPPQYAAGYASTGSTFGSTGSAVAPGTVAPSLPPAVPAGSYPSTTTSPGTAVPTPVTVAPSVPNFNSYAARVPVTYYRPILTTDPATGQQRVVMAPCTSYEYQTQRVPAVGRRSLFGSLFPPRQAPLPQAQPTYTLPSGGIPIATVPLIPVPTTTMGYGSYYGGYGTYSALQPGGVALPPGTASPSVTSAPTYTVPGACSSPAMGATTPGVTIPATPSPLAPSSGSPPMVLPPAGAPSSDPAANVPPSLPSTPTMSGISDRSKGPAINNEQQDQGITRSFVQQPTQRSTTSGPTRNEPSYRERTERELPVLRPIPLPQGFEPPKRWNPGLLSDEDLTAQRTSSPEATHGGADYKLIQWTSLVDSSAAADQSSDVAFGAETLRGEPTAAADAPSMEIEGSTARLRAIQSPPARLPAESRAVAGPSQNPSAGQQHRVAKPTTVSSPVYENSGWRASGR